MICNHLQQFVKAISKKQCAMTLWKKTYKSLAKSEAHCKIFGNAITKQNFLCTEACLKA